MLKDNNDSNNEFLKEFSFDIVTDSNNEIINEEAGINTITFERVINKVVNNEYEKQIILIYEKLRVADTSSPRDRNDVGKFYKVLENMEKQLKSALNDPSIKGVNIRNFHSRVLVQDRTKPFMMYPNKFACYEDVELYLGRVQTLKSRVNVFSKFAKYGME